MELKNIVYITINQCTGDFYIGVHETNPEVFDNYIGEGIYSMADAKQKRNDTNRFARAVRKYGYENFRRTTLRIYPGTKEGRQAALDLEATLVTETVLKSKHCYNTRTGGECGSLPSKRVYQYDKNGNFLRSYMSAKEAAICLECENIVSGKSSIKNCCCGKTETALGFVWSYKKEFKKADWSKPIAQYTLSGKFLRYWNSAKQIEVELGFTHVSQVISDNVKNNNNHTYKNFQWRYYTGDDSNIAPINDRFSNTRMRPVIMIDVLGNITEYENIRECVAKNPRLKQRCIVDCCMGKRKTHNSCKFQFKNVEDIV